MLVEFIEDGLFAKLKNQVKSSLPPEHLQKVDQVYML